MKLINCIANSNLAIAREIINANPQSDVEALLLMRNICAERKAKATAEYHKAEMEIELALKAKEKARAKLIELTGEMDELAEILIEVMKTEREMTSWLMYE